MMLTSFEYNPSPLTQESSNLRTFLMLWCLLIHLLISLGIFLLSFACMNIMHIGTMGPATAWENSQETWLQWGVQPNQISRLSEFTPSRFTCAAEKLRITISNSISQHRFTSQLFGSSLQGAMVSGKLTQLAHRHSAAFNCHSLSRSGYDNEHQCKRSAAGYDTRWAWNELPFSGKVSENFITFACSTLLR